MWGMIVVFGVVVRDYRNVWIGNMVIGDKGGSVVNMVYLRIERG